MNIIVKQRILNIVFGMIGIIITATVLTGYFIIIPVVTDIINFLNSLQIKVFKGEYYFILSFAITSIIFLITVLLLRICTVFFINKIILKDTNEKIKYFLYEKEFRNK